MEKLFYISQLYNHRHMSTLSICQAKAQSLRLVSKAETRSTFLTSIKKVISNKSNLINDLWWTRPSTYQNRHIDWQTDGNISPQNHVIHHLETIQDWSA